MVQMKAALPPDESQRLATLYALDLLDRPASPRLDRITRLACRLLNVPIALVTLVDAEVQWFRSRQGLDLVMTPREYSFCAHTILSDETMVVEDALNDLRFFDNPLVRQHPGVRFYAGCPIAAWNGSHLGTLAVMDLQPRKLSEGELSAFEDLGDLAREEIGSMALDVVDDLTGLVNRRGLQLIAAQTVPRAVREGESLSLLFIDLDEQSFTPGEIRRASDEALLAVAEVLRAHLRGADVPARFRSDEFAILLPDTAEKQADLVLSRLIAALEEARRHSLALRTVTINAGRATLDPSEEGFSLDTLIERADAAM